MAFNPQAFVAKIKEHVKLRKVFLSIDPNDPLKADERFNADQALRTCEEEIAAMTNRPPSKAVSISILDTFFSQDEENLIEYIIDNTVSRVCPLEYLLSFCREHVSPSSLLRVINTNLGLGISRGRDTEQDVENYPLNEKKKRDQVWVWLHRRGKPGYVDQTLHSKVLVLFSETLKQTIDQNTLTQLQHSEREQEREQKREQAPTAPTYMMKPEDARVLSDVPLTPSNTSTSWTWREWTRLIIGLAITGLAFAVLFSPLGPLVPFAAGIIAWVESAGWTMAVGVVASFVLGYTAAFFDYVAGFAIWLVAEVLIGALSYFASGFSILTAIGIQNVKASVLSLGVLFGLLNQDHLSDENKALVNLTKFFWQNLPTPLRIFFTGLTGILGFCIGTALFLAFSIPALLLSSIVELSDSAKGISWVHQSAMTLRHLFTGIVNKIKGAPSSPTQDAPHSLSPKARVELSETKSELPKEDSGKTSKQRAGLPSFKDTNFFSFFDVLSKRNDVHFKEVVTQHSLEENPRHAESSKQGPKGR